MKLRIFFILLTTVALNALCYAGSGTGDKSKPSGYLVHGKVVDQQSGEELSGVSIHLGATTVYSDLNGNFSCWVTELPASTTVSFVSYENKTIDRHALQSTELVVELSQH